MAHPVLARELQAMGYTVLDRPSITPDELEPLLADAVGLVLTTRIEAHQTLLEKAPHLQWIGRLGSGMELIDTVYAKSRGIVCFSSPEGNRLAVAEHALGMLLSILHRIDWSYREVVHGEWRRKENRGSELSGKKVGIIGYGNTGSELARLLEPFGVTVLAHDIHKTGFGGRYIQEATLRAITDQCQVISFHVPLTDSTRGMAGTEFFSALQQCPVLINTSRGKVVDGPALLTALEQRQLSGAALDVLPNEQLAGYSASEKLWLQRLTQRPDVLITPHIAGYSEQSFERMCTVLLQKLRGWGR